MPPASRILRPARIVLVARAIASAVFGKLQPLVVEDEPLIQMELESILEGMGFAHVHCACTLKEAGSHLRTRQIDIAVLDVHLPDGLPFELADELERRDIPFVFASATMERDIPIYLRSVPFVGKPFQASELRKALTGVLVDRLVRTDSLVLRNAGDARAEAASSCTKLA